MKINTIDNNIAIINSKKVLVADVQSALDMIATINYEVGCDRIILNKEAFCEDFFDLKTKLAGEVLQKFINYQVKVAIIGDFTNYSSKSLKDFIYESNKGYNLFFLENKEKAIEKIKSL